MLDKQLEDEIRDGLNKILDDFIFENSINNELLKEIQWHCDTYLRKYISFNKILDYSVTPDVNNMKIGMIVRVVDFGRSITVMGCYTTNYLKLIRKKKLNKIFPH